MSIIQAYKSDSDGKLFQSKEKYIKHLRSIAAKKMHEKRIKKLQDEQESFMDLMGKVKSIDELNQFIKDNWKWFWTNGVRRNNWRRTKPEFHEYVEVSINNISWCERLSNSHSSPKMGVENFMNHDGKPKGYPGWRGRIDIKVKPPMAKYRGKEYMLDGYGSDYFDSTIIHTGSGGGGGGKGCKSYSYAVTLWAADFPVMHEIVRREQYLHQENEKRQRVWGSVGGTGTVTHVTEIPKDWKCPDPLIVQDEEARLMW